MADEKELFPGFKRQLETAVNIAVTSALADLDTVNLKRCQERLAEARQDLARSQAQADVWQELAARRKNDLEPLQQEVANLQARGAFLESVIENHKASDGSGK